MNTSSIKRQNGTDRHRCSRKIRKSYCFSKDWDVHRAATCLTMYSYNLLGGKDIATTGWAEGKMHTGDGGGTRQSRLEYQGMATRSRMAMMSGHRENPLVLPFLSTHFLAFFAVQILPQRRRKVRKGNFLEPPLTRRTGQRRELYPFFPAFQVSRPEKPKKMTTFSINHRLLLRGEDCFSRMCGQQHQRQKTPL